MACASDADWWQRSDTSGTLNRETRHQEKLLSARIDLAKPCLLTSLRSQYCSCPIPIFHRDMFCARDVHFPHGLFSPRTLLRAHGDLFLSCGSRGWRSFFVIWTSLPRSLLLQRSSTTDGLLLDSTGVSHSPLHQDGSPRRRLPAEL